MLNNSTNINKTNNHLSSSLTEHKKRPWHMMLNIQVLAWDSAQKCGRIKPVKYVLNVTKNRGDSG